jgi:hypothetical protein
LIATEDRKISGYSTFSVRRTTFEHTFPASSESIRLYKISNIPGDSVGRTDLDGYEIILNLARKSSSRAAPAAGAVHGRPERQRID